VDIGEHMNRTVTVVQWFLLTGGASTESVIDYNLTRYMFKRTRSLSNASL